MNKNYIFNTLLRGGLFLVGVSFLFNLFNYLFISIHQKQVFEGSSPLILLVIWIGIFNLKNIYENNKQIAILFFLILLWLPAAYASLIWGALFYQSVIIFILVITLSGILINSKASFITTLITSLFLISVTYLQNQKHIDFIERPNSDNDVFNAIIASSTLIVIQLVNWLYNIEIKGSLEKIKNSEKKLKQELLIKTKQIKLAQAEKMLHWQQLAEIGKSAAEVFHDIKNPLTSASINLEELYASEYLPKSELKKIDLIF